MTETTTTNSPTFTLREDGRFPISLGTLRRLHNPGYLTGQINHEPHEDDRRIDLVQDPFIGLYDGFICLNTSDRADRLMSLIDRACAESIFKYQFSPVKTIDEELKALFTYTTAARHMRSFFEPFSQPCFERSRRNFIEFIKKGNYCKGDLSESRTRIDWALNVNSPVEAYNSLWLLNAETLESYEEQVIKEVIPHDYLMAFDRNHIDISEQLIVEALILLCNRLPKVPKENS